MAESNPFLTVYILSTAVYPDMLPHFASCTAFMKFTQVYLIHTLIYLKYILTEKFINAEY